MVAGWRNEASRETMGAGESADEGRALGEISWFNVTV